MTISKGDQLPNANLLISGENGPESVELSTFTKDKTVLIFAVPGAFTPTCTKSHLPGYVDNAPAFYEKGVDHIICICVNDPFVAKAWGEMIGADQQNITVLADPSSELTKALGVNFDAPPAGLYGRSKRYALLAKNNEVTQFEIEDNPGVCELSSADYMLGLL